MAISDAQFRIGAIGVGIVLAASITALRFCGSLSLPPRPDAVTSTAPAATDSNASPVIYQDYLAKDAQLAGVRTPTIDEMSRKLPYHVDSDRHVLEVGAPPIELAGLRLQLERDGATIVLDIANTTSADVAYQVVTAPTPATNTCGNAQAIALNAMVIAKGQHERRVECVWRRGLAIAVTRVETIEVPPLSAWYLSQVNPLMVGGDPRLARAHRAPKTKDRCSDLLPRVVQAGLENGEIGWRDLVDFYARHRCQTYSFPPTYRALDADRQRPIPAVAAGM
ncbi:MAG TPA: hypothetical protein VFQ53_43620 [Kofleriaceae bacterium]|nr:hypothetical protein [Kofleriaceae bacterium]